MDRRRPDEQRRRAVRRHRALKRYDEAMGPLRVTASLVIPADELDERFVRSSGPGGQNVNKVASKVELRWTPGKSRALAGLDERARSWLLGRLAGRLSETGVLVVTSSLTRDQPVNRQDARAKLAEIVRRALERPRPRRPTRPTRGSVERRLGAKKRRGARKRERRGDD
jgi:ribosome-associated protein